MNFRLHPEARRELLAAAEYYDEERRGLGDAFLSEAEDSFRRIKEQPWAYTEVDQLCRRVVLSTYPYRIHYTVKPSEIVVYAVAHQSRDPKYWVDRLK